MQEITTSIEINARPELVWEVLIDTENYPKWNPFIIMFEGKIEVGEQLHVELKSGDGSMNFTPIVQEVRDNQKFSWLGKLFLPRLFDGYHIFELKEISENTTLFIHTEEFRGLFVWPILRMIRKETENNFIAMNTALKNRVEAINT